ncbi:MAG: TatD family hydrolase [Candidatus Omnitrophica bacterium]|nr:TatD family hydrolase [Candidatus Omnitrophota bacterium]
MIETHAHLDFSQYESDRESVIERARACGIKKIINVASSVEGSVSSLALARAYDMVYASCGVHPHEAGKVDESVIEQIRRLAVSSDKVVAIGEVGIDFYRNTFSADSQYNALRLFLGLSRQLGLPVIFHCRQESPEKYDAFDVLFKAMEECLEKPYRAVIHCFSGDKAALFKCLDLGLYISYTCNITYKNAGRLRDVLKATPLERLLLETDSPFLSPQEKRGLRNEPSYIKYLLKSMADIIGLPEPDIEEHTDKNAGELFFNRKQ